MVARKHLSEVDRKRYKNGKSNGSTRTSKWPGEKHQYYTVDQVKEALRATGGIKSAAARYLAKKTGRGSGRGTVIDHYIRRTPELAEYLTEVEERTVDLAEQKLILAIKNSMRKDHMRAVTFYLSTKGKDRGYSHRSEVTGAGGGPIKYTSLGEVDLSKLSEDDLEQLERIFSKASFPKTEEEAPGHIGKGKPVASRRGNGIDHQGKVSS